jgi:hypothetical protein
LGWSACWLSSSSKKIGEALLKIDRVLECLLEECKACYFELSRQQKLDEALAPEQKRVPSQLKALPQLASAMENDFVAIHEPFELAANEIRNEVRRSMVP